MAQTRVYIGGLSPKCRESDLERFFAGYGHLRSLLLKRGYGFVEFEDSHDAEDAVDCLNGAEMLGYKVQVEHATPREFRRFPTFRGRRGGGRGGFYNGRGRGGGYYGGGGGYGNNIRQQKRGSGFRIIVKNLPSRISWQELKDFMRQAGEISYADVCDDLNEGTVEFRYHADLRRAMETLDNAELDGSKIRLIEETRVSSSGGSGSGGSGGGGYSRSRNGKNWREGHSASKSRSESRSRSRSPYRHRKK